MHVVTDGSVVNATAGSARRSRRKRPTNSATRCWASVALPPLPKVYSRPPEPNSVRSRSPTVRTWGSRSRMLSWAAKWLATSFEQDRVQFTVRAGDHRVGGGGCGEDRAGGGVAPGGIELTRAPARGVRRWRPLRRPGRRRCARGSSRRPRPRREPVAALPAAPRPEAVHLTRASPDRAPVGGEHRLHRVQRARPDVPEHHPQRSHGQHHPRPGTRSPGPTRTARAPQQPPTGTRPRAAGASAPDGLETVVL